MATPIFTQKDVDRFFSKTKRNEETGCLEWTAGCNRGGYGSFHVGASMVGAHRVAWAIAYGSIPESLHVLHHCDNPPCVEVGPGHLFLGTPAANAADKAAKKRGNQPTGDLHYSRQRPHLLARGLRHGSRTHPERVPCGSRHGSHTHPERLSRGDGCPNAKLTTIKVAEARALRIAGFTLAALAERFGVTISTIHAATSGKTWAAANLAAPAHRRTN